MTCWQLTPISILLHYSKQIKLDNNINFICFCGNYFCGEKKRLTFNCISWFPSYLMADKTHQKHTKLTIYTKLIHRQFQWINCEFSFVFIAVSCVTKHNIIFDRCQFYYRWNDYKFILLSEIRWQLTNYEHFIPSISHIKL